MSAAWSRNEATSIRPALGVSSCRVKHWLLITLLATAALGIAVALVRQERSYQRAVYHGRHASEWAAELYPNFDPRGTNEAMQALRELGSNAVPALRSLLDSRAPFYEKPLLQNARRLPVSTRRYLFEKLKPGQSVVRRISAARALSVIGSSASAAVPDLIAALKDPAGEIRWAAAQALGRLGGHAISALAAAATNENVTLRQTAVYALGEAGTNAAPAAAVLFDCALDTNESIRASALHALSRIGSAGLSTVLEAFATDDPVRRTAATKAIQVMNRPPRQVSRTLLEFATNASPNVRRQSLEALQVLQLNYPQVVATFVRALDDLDPDVRCAAAQAMSQASGWTTNTALGEVTARTLGLSGSLGSNIVVKLNGLLTDPEPSVRTAAQRALKEIQTTTPN